MSLAASLKGGGTLSLITHKTAYLLQIRHAVCAHVHSHTAHKINRAIKYQESELFNMSESSAAGRGGSKTQMKFSSNTAYARQQKRCVSRILGSKKKLPNHPQLKKFCGSWARHLGQNKECSLKRLGASRYLLQHPDAQKPHGSFRKKT